MIATINGITVEGTPEEIFEYAKLNSISYINTNFSSFKLSDLNTRVDEKTQKEIEKALQIGKHNG